MNRQQRRAAERQRPKPPRILQGCTRENLAIAAMRADLSGQTGVAELLREVMKGEMGILFANDRAATVPAAELMQIDRPTVAIVGDDDYLSTGPGGWSCAPAIAAWARCAVIHAAGASAETYREAVKGAKLMGAAALIETDTDHVRAWAQMFQGKPVLLVLPRTGTHPTLPPRSAMQ